MKRILLIGEPMGLFMAQEPGPLDAVNGFSIAVCGAELNVAIGLSRLGHTVGYYTKLGCDPFADRIIRTIAENHISTDLIRKTTAYPTGFMFKSKVTEGDPSIYYFRKGSAASSLSEDDIDSLDLSGYDAVHITGITPALSSTAREAAFALFNRAAGSGLRISFDPNLRPQLWKSEAEMKEVINSLAFQSELFLPGIGEAKTLTSLEDPEKIADYYLSRGTRTVIIKLGASGAFYRNMDTSGYVPGYTVSRIIDTVGAGDGFAAGVLSALREGLPLQDAVLRGNAIGALQLMNQGDNEGLPTREQLDVFMKTAQRSDKTE